ncbi:hypothetical protein SBBP2_880095 [Burkholderiales bacterium]|nr:hypothetical protein SBBP2_880095 [Burkholderiales bacterium]
MATRCERRKEAWTTVSERNAGADLGAADLGYRDLFHLAQVTFSCALLPALVVHSALVATQYPAICVR